MTATGGVPVEEWVEPVDPAPWLALIDDRFGMPGEAFQDFLFFAPTCRFVSIARRGLRVPARPEPVEIGLRFLRVDMRFPKLTTAATFRFGHLAERNAIELPAGEAAAFARRRRLQPSDARLGACTGTGYVVVRHRGATIGLGLLHRRAEPPTLISLIPKGWALEGSDGEGTG